MEWNHDNNKEKPKYSSEIPARHTGLDIQTNLEIYFPLPIHQEGLIDGFGSRGEGCRLTCELLIA